MKTKLSREDMEFLKSKYTDKVLALGYNLLACDIRGETFEHIMRGGENVNRSNKKQRQEWLAGAMKRMEESFPTERVKEMRAGNACCLGGKRHELAREIHDKYDTVGERFEAFSKERYIVGDKAWETGENTYRVTFWENPPEGGSCACLRYVPRDEPMPKSWCDCCGGHIKYHFQTALGVKADCECVSSSLSSCGREPCTFELKVAEVTG